MNSALMFSKASDEWSTPDDLFRALHAEFNFQIDLAASPENAKCEMFYTKETDALSGDVDWTLEAAHVWRGWCNPPYSQCAAFVAKAARQQRRGFLTVMLIPARTDTKYWHEHIWDRQQHRPRPGVEVRFLKGRLKFGNATHGAPFPSVVVVFRPVTSDQECAA